MKHGLEKAVFDFLCDPASHGGGRVQLIETHAACVFLTGERAIKVRKSVRYPYLDFSTLEKREAACKRELELNRHNAPDLYLGLSWITRASDGELELDGESERLEPCVVMRRFSQSDILSEMAREGRLTLALMRDLAHAIRAAHRRAPSRPEVSARESLVDVLAGNLESFAEHPDVFAPESVAMLGKNCRAALQAAAERLDKRAGEGFVRRCHGDLHLKNIVMQGDTPVLFDALEFDESLAEIDILYDLAFLLMDLLSRDMRAHANALLNAWLDGCDPVALDGLAALPVMLSLRAQVRAKVAADRGDADEAARYFALSECCLRSTGASLIAVGGLSGTGKSTLARNLAPEIGGPCGALVVRSDVERKATRGVPETEHLDEDAYKPAVTRMVYDRIMEKARIALAAGTAVILDAVFARPGERDAAEKAAQSAGVHFRGFWLEAPAKTLKQRVTDRRNDASDADARIVAQQLEYDLGTIRWTRVEAEGGPEATLARVRAALGHDS